MLLNLMANLGYYVPECLALVCMLGALFLESTYKDGEKGRPFLYIAILIGLVATLVALGFNMDVKGQALFYNAVVIDPFSTALKMIMVVGCLGTLYMAYGSKDIYSYMKAEFTIMTMGTLVGGMLLVSSNNLLTLYLGIEILSILAYVLASLKKEDALSAEAGLKYALYGGIASGVMLFGASHIYGVLGSIQYADIATKIPTLKTEEIAILLPSFIMFFAGIGYKIACVPFHMWSPDVYEGSPIPVTAFFSIVPKVAALGALVRLTMVFFAEPGVMTDSWIGLIQVISALTMTVGNVSAIGQRSLKRLMAYSSISHAGVMLLGVVVMDQIGVSSIVFYALFYLFMTLIAFYIINYISNMYGNDHMERFSGLVYKHPLMAIAFTITLFSLGGMPPMAGFVAKFSILMAVISKKYYGIAIVLVLNSVISLYYYIKVITVMIFGEAENREKIVGFNFVNQGLVIILSVPVLALGIFWGPVMTFAQNAKIFIK